MSCGELTGDLKTDREESLMKDVGFVHAYAKKAKNRKINDEKGGDKQQKQESYSTSVFLRKMLGTRYSSVGTRFL